MERRVLFWRRLDVEGFERLELSIGADGVEAFGTVLALEAGGFKLEHRWRLDAAWRAQSLVVERWSDTSHGTLHLERRGDGWLVDGEPRGDLDGAEEPDLSVTPFCNTLPIRRTRSTRTLDTAYVDGATLTVARSKQRYDRQGPRTLRYVDLGLSKGFEAGLEVDDDGLVVRYEHLFERAIMAR